MIIVFILTKFFWFKSNGNDGSEFISIFDFLLLIQFFASAYFIVQKQWIRITIFLQFNKFLHIF